jgi:hypothetical protein
MAMDIEEVDVYDGWGTNCVLIRAQTATRPEIHLPTLAADRLIIT